MFLIMPAGKDDDDWHKIASNDVGLSLNRSFGCLGLFDQFDNLVQSCLTANMRGFHEEGPRLVHCAPDNTAVYLKKRQNR